MQLKCGYHFVAVVWWSVYISTFQRNERCESRIQMTFEITPNEAKMAKISLKKKVEKKTTLKPYE